MVRGPVADARAGTRSAPVMVGWVVVQRKAFCAPPRHQVRRRRLSGQDQVRDLAKNSAFLDGTAARAPRADVTAHGATSSPGEARCVRVRAGEASRRGTQNQTSAKKKEGGTSGVAPLRRSTRRRRTTADVPKPKRWRRPRPLRLREALIFEGADPDRLGTGAQDGGRAYHRSRPGCCSRTTEVAGSCPCRRAGGRTLGQRCATLRPPPAPARGAAPSSQATVHPRCAVRGWAPTGLHQPVGPAAGRTARIAPTSRPPEGRSQAAVVMRASWRDWRAAEGRRNRRPDVDQDVVQANIQDLAGIRGGAGRKRGGPTTRLPGHDGRPRGRRAERGRPGSGEHHFGLGTRRHHEGVPGQIVGFAFKELGL